MSIQQPTASVKFTANTKGNFTALDVIKNPEHLDKFQQAKDHLFASTSKITGDKNIDAQTLIDIENEANAAHDVYKKHNDAKLSQMNFLASPISNASYIAALICVSASGLYVLFVPIALLLSSVSNLYTNVKKTGVTKTNICLAAGVFIAATLSVLAVLTLAGLASPASPLIIVSIAVLSDILVGTFASQLDRHDTTSETHTVLNRISSITTFIKTAEKAQKPHMNQQKKALYASLKAHKYELCDKIRDNKDPKEKKSYAKQISAIKYQRISTLIEQKLAASPSKAETAYHTIQKDLLQIIGDPQMSKDIRLFQTKIKAGRNVPTPSSLASVDKKILTHFIHTPIFHEHGSKRWQTSKKGMTQLMLTARILSLNLSKEQTNAYLDEIKNLPNKPHNINNALVQMCNRDADIGKKLSATYQEAKDILVASKDDIILDTLSDAEAHIHKYYKREAPFQAFEAILTVEVVLSLIGLAIALPFMASPPFMIALASIVMLHCTITMGNIAYDKIPAFRSFVTAGQEGYESLIESASMVKQQFSKTIVKAVGLDKIAQSPPTKKYAINIKSGITSCVSKMKIGNIVCKKTTSKSQTLKSTAAPSKQKQDEPEPKSKRPSIFKACKKGLKITTTILKNLKK